MKRAAAAIAILAVAAFVLSFLHPFGDPRTDSPQTELPKGDGTLLQHAHLPADAKRILITKCADCHSNETRWPVYARLPPASWLIERDIVEARKQMNLSKWEQLPAEGQDVLIAKIIHEAKSGDMPPLQYRILHWGAKLNASDVNALSSIGARGTDDVQASGSGDASRGRLAFQKRCTGCHAMDEDREGPRLAGVFGRKAGSVPGFDYSAGLKNSGVTWNEASLERWLKDPDLVVPDNKMEFHVPKAQERSDLVAYLKQSK